jgi:hypothetical protein
MRITIEGVAAPGDVTVTMTCSERVLERLRPAV